MSCKFKYGTHTQIDYVLEHILSWFSMHIFFAPSLCRRCLTRHQIMCVRVIFFSYLAAIRCQATRILLEKLHSSNKTSNIKWRCWTFLHFFSSYSLWSRRRLMNIVVFFSFSFYLSFDLPLSLSLSSFVPPFLSSSSLFHQTIFIFMNK